MSGPAGRPAARQVGRAARLMDGAALVLVVAGAGLYMYAQRGMSELAAGRMRYATSSGPGGGLNLAVWGDLLQTSRVGLVVALLGVGLGTLSFVRHAYPRTPAPIDEQADHS